ncbi:RNA-directed DNA polymerase, eukaryota, reverse transcriptase zinc-binding domain protein [Tanacetum coccineum]
MSTKYRSSIRQKKVPSRFSNHVMGNSSQKKNDYVEQIETEEIRVEQGGLNDNFGENDNLMDKGVFGNMDKNQNGGEKEAPADTHGVSINTEPISHSPIDVSKDCYNVDAFHNSNNIPSPTTVNQKQMNDKDKESYVSMLRKYEIPRKLNFKPPMTNDTGENVIVFDDVLIMAPNKLRYNIRRMWGKFGIKDIIVNNDGTCLFKFRDLEGLNSVIEQGPWMVNKRLLIVKKWSHEIGMQMTKHNKLPIWVRMTVVPLEAWSVDGISALASSLGNPLVMDNMIANMCHNGLGRLDFARVLVEMDADIEFKKTIEVQYRDNSNKVKGTKMVNVTYDWKPAVCTHCKVFGHNSIGCLKRPGIVEEDELAKIKEEEQRIKMDKNGRDEQT